MQTVSIKEQLHHYIEIAEENQLQAIYTILEDKIHARANERISVAQYNKELTESEARMDKGEYYTQEEIKRMIK